MRKKLSLLLLLALVSPAAAQQTELRTEYERLTETPKPLPSVPPDLRAIVVAVSPERLEVRGLSGQSIPVDIEWWEPSDFTLLHGGRYLGMSRSGYEDYGYVLVDRAAREESAVIDTGHLPAFSPDGRYFAAADISGSGFGNLEGIAAWEVLAERTVGRFFTDAVPAANDWRIDGWAGVDCVEISAVEMGWQPRAGEDWESALPRAPRVHYRLQLGEEVSLVMIGDRPGCGHDTSDG